MASNFSFSSAISFSWTSKAIVLALFSLACVVSGCNHIYYDGTRAKPPHEALVGIWIPDSSSLKYMHDEGGYIVSTKPEIVLKADGKYELNNLPDWIWLDDGVSQGTFRSETGMWEVSLDGDGTYWILLLRAHDSERGIGLLGQRAPYRLRFRFGHVDDRRDMTFVKKE